MERGWVKLHRQITEWEWFKDPATAHLFIYLLAKANREPTRYRGVEIPAGGLTTSREALSRATGLSEQQVRTALKHLISTGEVTKKSTRQYTLLIVNSYARYQETNQEPNQQVTNNQPTTNQRVTTNKNIRIKNKELRKKDSMSSSGEHDTAAQVIRYLNERAGKNFSEKSEANRKLISGRIREGRTIEDFKQVIDLKVSQWKGDEKMDQYLRPATLFRPQKFEEYLNEAPAKREMTKEELQAEYGGTWL